jgi:DNA repair photolyase
MSGPIYTPGGRAREYSPKALNLYTTCVHGCGYCYAPKTLRKSQEDYFKISEPKQDIISKLEEQLKSEKITEQVLLSFVGDPYQHGEDNTITRQALDLLLKHKVPVAILTKGGDSCLKDIDVFKKFNKSIMVGATLTFTLKEYSTKWEPFCPDSLQRLTTLEQLNSAGIRTFASFEPVIDPQQSLELIRQSLNMDCIDLYKLGKLNGMPSIEKSIEWDEYLKQALDLIRPFGKAIYVKEDLAYAARDIELTAEERDFDYHCVTRGR